MARFQEFSTVELCSTEFGVLGRRDFILEKKKFWLSSDPMINKFTECCSVILNTDYTI